MEAISARVESNTPMCGALIMARVALRTSTLEFQRKWLNIVVGDMLVGRLGAHGVRRSSDSRVGCDNILLMIQCARRSL